MKRILILFLALLALSAGAYFLVSENAETKTTTITKNDRDFRVENLEEIHKITIKTRRRPELHLSRQGSDWLVNYKNVISPNSMKRLLEVVGEMRMKYIPHNNTLAHIKNEMELIGLHIEIYDKNDKKIKDFVIGGSTSDERGTYVQMVGSNQPYVMEMASYEGSIRTVFLPDAEQWRDRIFLKEDVSKLTKVTVDYPKSKEDSFVINVDESTVDPLYDYTMTKKGKLRKGTIKAYLRQFEKIGAEAFENHHRERDSISNLVPFVKFKLENKDGSQKEISMFPIKDIYFENFNTTSVDETALIERYFADCSWGDFMMVQHLLVKKVLKPIDYFYE